MASIVNSLKLLADETRFRLLLLLGREELSVLELQEILGMGQSRISSHLGQLRRGGLLVDRRAGKNIYYALAPALKEPQWAGIFGAGVGQIPDAERDQRALRLILSKRKDRAREYFNQLAGRFGRTYCPGRSWEALAHLLFSLMPAQVIVDMGAGEGTLAQLLAKRARQVIAVDSSEKMVEYGGELARRHGFENLEYRLGDMEDPPVPEETADLVLFSQALHHAVSPGRAAAAAYRILKGGGRVAVLDLLQHQFEKAREMYADTWLGFTESDLHHFLESAGFEEVEVAVVSRDEQNPQFQTVLATGLKRAGVREEVR
jgi:ubiquinone/menaquinone biosynthesis C-methylase UbiE